MQKSMKTYFQDTTDGTKHQLPVILHTNGSVSDVRPEDDGLLHPSSDDAVGTEYEEIQLRPWHDIVMLRSKNRDAKEYNYRASLMAQRRIEGDVVIMNRKSQNTISNEQHQSES